MADYKQCLNIIEDAFASYMAGRVSVDKMCTIISDNLSACDFENRKKHYTVSVCAAGAHSQEPFFGCHVYPSINALEKIVDATIGKFQPVKVILKMWEEVTEWVIEFDPRMLDRTMVSLNQKEMVACLLHEVGHVTYADAPVARFSRITKALCVKQNEPTNLAMSAGYMLFTIPFVLGSVPSLVDVFAFGGRLSEQKADKFATKYGYGEYLVSALDKIIAAFGSSNGKDVEKMTESKTQWAATMVKDAAIRRNKLANELFNIGSRSKSTYVKSLCATILDNTGVSFRQTFTGDAVESYEGILELMGRDNDIFYKTALESWDGAFGPIKAETATFKFMGWEDEIRRAMESDKFIPGTKAFEAIMRTKMQAGLPSWKRVDRIQVEIDKIRSHTDRELVLDMIYDIINEIQEFMDYIRNDSIAMGKYKPEAERMLQQLDQYRELVLGKHDFKTRYRVFVQSPEGYEG